MKDDMPVEKGRLKNSHLSNQNFAFGLSHIGERSYAGVSVSRFLSKSGIAGFGYYNFAKSGDHHGGTRKAPVRKIQHPNTWATLKCKLWTAKLSKAVWSSTTKQILG